ncbi:MAG: sugar phosphate isomerase/epimerase [Opitutales bacterium]|jgi:L-ribulose-5-phosphate 3-epimerase|nr:sugar phosphate isomerase/epimerase [Opitutales bacterium]MBT6379570.1 sugar phosphate isomerase/epimerase [Opitutales bacterium]MBT6768912.1 sugar phosphate isomerase/epimerase [Opitutales bacterium]MDG2253866.1 sugar phosphate isomerase/epimerase [Opitutaceae bacterium]
MPHKSNNRRNFLRTVAALGASSILPTFALADPHASASLKGRLYKTLKIRMVKIPDISLVEKFIAAKTAGFLGIEMNSPGMNVAMTKAAIAASGLPVDGTVCSTHWKIRHSSPDASVRAQALADLKQAIRDTHAVGGHTVLLVVGHGDDGPVSEIRPRSIDNIRKAIPLAAELGISIVIENVWNRFLYDHEGDSNQSAADFVSYIDSFNSPWVGMQFDIGNHWKYGAMGDWIRQLGKRVKKLDVKGFSRQEGKFTQIGEGDIDFADVRKALIEIDYHGWVAAEVKGGDLEALETISRQMDRAFGI